MTVNLTEEESTKSYTYKASQCPYNVDPYLEFLEISDDGHTLLGCSNLTGNYWNGSAWYFDSVELAPEKIKATAAHGCESGVVTGKFLDSPEKMVIGEDSGALTIFSIVTFENNDVHFVPQMYVTHHDASITCVSVSQSKQKTVSVGMDMAICIWDNEGLNEERRMSPAHSKPITSVCYTPQEGSPVFVSASLDGTAILWDTRLGKPATVIKNNKTIGYSSVIWKDSNEVILGSQSGKIEIVDSRMAVDGFSTVLFNRPIHNMAINDSGLLAVCADSNTVVVWDCNTNSKMYTDSRHKGFVRGLSWDPKSKKLFTCGYGYQVLSHDVLGNSDA